MNTWVFYSILAAIIILNFLSRDVFFSFSLIVITFVVCQIDARLEAEKVLADNEKEGLKHSAEVQP